MSRIESSNLSQQVSDDLGRAILSGNFAAESCLPSESKLCEAYGISRTAIREAVKMLSAKGMVSSHSRNGIKVLPAIEWNLFDSRVLSWMLESQPSLDLVKEFFQVRLAIETQAAVLAANNATECKLLPIRQAVSEMEAASNDPGLDFCAAEVNFHTRLLVASANNFFAQLTQFVKAAILLRNQCVPSVQSNKRELTIIHRNIYNALETKQADRAKILMNHLLEDALLVIERQMSESQDTVQNI